MFLVNIKNYNFSLSDIISNFLTVFCLKMPPYISIEKDSQNNIVNTSGYLADLWNILEHELQFK